MIAGRVVIAQRDDYGHKIRHYLAIGVYKRFQVNLTTKNGLALSTTCRLSVSSCSRTTTRFPRSTRGTTPSEGYRRRHSTDTFKDIQVWCQYRRTEKNKKKNGTTEKKHQSARWNGPQLFLLSETNVLFVRMPGATCNYVQFFQKKVFQKKVFHRTIGVVLN
jgi:hypothetical protein